MGSSPVDSPMKILLAKEIRIMILEHELALKGASGQLMSVAEINFAMCAGNLFKFAKLSGAILQDCNLVGLDLSYTDFSYADLSGTDMRHCILYNTIFTGANLSNSLMDVEKITLNSADGM